MSHLLNLPLPRDFRNSLLCCLKNCSILDIFDLTSREQKVSILSKCYHRVLNYSISLHVNDYYYSKTGVMLTTIIRITTTTTMTTLTTRAAMQQHSCQVGTNILGTGLREHSQYGRHALLNCARA